MILSACIYTYTYNGFVHHCVPGAFGGQKMHWGLALQIITNHHVGAGNRTPVLSPAFFRSFLRSTQNGYDNVRRLT